MRINVIFPVAGEASRFGGAFKPFLNIGDLTFIEVTYEPFKKWSHLIESVYFICTEEQEKNFNVSSRMQELIDHDSVKTITIKEKTIGPYQTLKQGIEQNRISGKAIVCDCDHSLNVDAIFEASSLDFDAVIPTWNIKEDEWMNWSKVVMENQKVKMICEKERISSKEFDVKGIIGCILFNNIQDRFIHENKIYVSECLQGLLTNNKEIGTVSVTDANFYGDKKMLENFVEKRRKQCSVFCDIDGVLVKHSPHSTCNKEDNETLQGISKLKEWRKDGHKIILTTARNEKYRECTKELLKEIGVSYDDIVMSLPSGPRVLINDHKPSKPFVNQANSVELCRDKGLSGVSIDKYITPNDVDVIKEFEGGSFAKTYLIKGAVRKHIVKTKDNMVHYEKLKRQCADLERLNFLWPRCTPNVICEKDCEFDYYFDMEHLYDYKTLADYEEVDRIYALDNLFEGMNSKVYSMSKEIDGIGWVNSHLEKKIYPKLENYSKNNKFHYLINSGEVKINGVKYKGLKHVLESIDKHAIKPKSIRPIHGDFTFENIMWNKKDIKLIDMDGSDCFDAAELDLGKMCQSVFSRFDMWKNKQDLIHSIKTPIEFTCNSDYFEIHKSELCDKVIEKWSEAIKDDKETIKMKGIFYMCMYFIRFVPFRLKMGEDHALFALIMAVVWLSKITNKKDS
tara:strand:- start:4928 stop:6967 length:2040 start_codon:yes stop_codon:yes gene_type:complete